MNKRDILPQVKKPVIEEPIEIDTKEEEEIFKLPEKKSQVVEPEEVPISKPKKLDEPAEKPKRKKRNPTEKQLEALRIARETRSRITAQKKGKSPDEKLKDEEMEQLAYLEAKYKRKVQTEAPPPTYVPQSIDYSQIPKTEVDYDRIINGVSQRYYAMQQQQKQEQERKQASRSATIDLLSGRKGNINRTFQQTHNIRKSFGNKFKGDW